MHPLLIPGLPVQTFGLCIAVGALLAWRLVERLARDRPDVGNLLFLLLVAGIAGARAAHVVEYWRADGFDRDFLSVFAVWKGGLVFYGGLVAAAAAFAAWCAAKRADPLALADTIAVAIPLAHAFGRIGCFFFGCCWGRVSSCPLAVSFPRLSPAWHDHLRRGLVGANAPGSLPVLPTQLFEAAALLALFAALLFLYRRCRRWTAAAYLAGYGVLRFFLEFLRDDERPSLAGLSSAQVFSFAMVAAGAAFFAWTMARARRAGRAQPPTTP